MASKLVIKLTIEIQQEVYCAICNQPILSNQKATIDHWIPKRHGGTNDLSNLRPAHKICNCIKSDFMPDVFMQNKKVLFENALEHWHIKQRDREIIINALKSMNNKRRR